MINNNENLKEVTNRLTTIRVRTWTLTLAIIVTLIFYFLVNLATKQAINPIDFILLCVVQIIVHCLYFPDGSLYGEKNHTFITNKKLYNEKASAINNKGQIAQLRAFCKHEFLERQQRYIVNECGVIGISIEELEQFKQLDEKTIKTLKSFELKNADGTPSKLIFFSKFKRQKLYKLLFHKIPVTENFPETILSAVENNGNHAIKDESIHYKITSYVRKFLLAVVIGGVFAYIGYTVRDGFGLAEVVNILMYLTTIFTTAVMAFSSGENCSKIYKNRFYVELTNFIDRFNEWNNTNSISTNTTNLIDNTQKTEQTGE